MTTGKRPVQIVEIDYPSCANIFGESPCTASAADGDECFNTLRTCLDKPNYILSNITLRFGRNIEALPKGITVFPTLQSVSTSPTVLNIGAQNTKAGALGKRGTISVTLQDTIYHDRLTDPYVLTRDYDPSDQGTFWRKFKARVPFYSGIGIKVLDGYEGEALASMRTRYYVIDKISGPDSSGRVTITGKDILTLADKKLAQAPAASSFTLLADIGENDLGFFIYGAETEVPATGYASIGNEIITYNNAYNSAEPLVYTRISVIARRAFATDPASHDAGDVFQPCLIYNNVRVDQIMKDLIVNHAGISTSYWDAQNDTEATEWLTPLTLTGVVAKPTGVDELLAELAQVGPQIWWDDVAQKIRIRATRPGIVTEIESVTEANDIIEGSISIEDKPDEQISQIWVYYDIIDRIKDFDKSTNYKSVQIRVDSDLETDLGKQKIKKITSRWLTNSNVGAILAYQRRTMDQFREVPSVLTFELDAKDRERIWTGDVVEISTKHVTDAKGAATPVLYQVISAAESDAGHRVAYKCQSIGDKSGTITEIDRPCYIVADDTPAYNDATAEQRDPLGGFIGPDTGVFSDGLPLYKFT